MESPIVTPAKAGVHRLQPAPINGFPLSCLRRSEATSASRRQARERRVRAIPLDRTVLQLQAGVSSVEEIRRALDDGAQRPLKTVPSRIRRLSPRAQGVFRTVKRKPRRGLLSRARPAAMSSVRFLQ